MNTIRGSAKQLGPRYMAAVIESTLTAALGDDYTFRGKYNSRANYMKNDVVVIIDNRTPLLKRALEDNITGEFNLDKWAAVIFSGGGSGDGGISIITIDLDIPITGWVESNNSDYRYACYIENSKIKASMVPSLTIYPDYQDVAADCGLCLACNTSDGVLTVYSQKVPSEVISASLTLYSAAGGSASVYTSEITIPTTGWVADATMEDYELSYTLADANITAEMTPQITIYPDSLDDAAECGLCRTCQTTDGGIIFYAHTAPKNAIPALFTGITSSGTPIVDLPIATATKLGCIKLGENMIGKADGTVDVNINIDDDSFDNEVERVVAGESDVKDAIDEVWPVHMSLGTPKTVPTT